MELSRYTPDGPAHSKPPRKRPLLIQCAQRILDGRTGTLRVDQIRAGDIAVVTHHPDGCACLPNHLLPEEVGAAEVAIAIQPGAVGKREIMRPDPARLRLLAVPDIGGTLGGDDEGLERGKVHDRKEAASARGVKTAAARALLCQHRINDA
jgi:hypothetical protein